MNAMSIDIYKTLKLCSSSILSCDAVTLIPLLEGKLSDQNTVAKQSVVNIYIFFCLNVYIFSFFFSNMDFLPSCIYTPEKST